MDKLIKKVKRFFNQTHVHNALLTIYQAVVIAVLAAMILAVVVIVINAAVP